MKILVVGFVLASIGFAQPNLDLKTKYGWLRFSETRIEKSPIAANMVLAGKIKNHMLWYVEKVSLQLTCPDGLKQDLQFLYLWDGQEKSFRLATSSQTPNALTNCTTTLGEIVAGNSLEKAKEIIKQSLNGDASVSQLVENLEKGNPKVFRIALLEVGRSLPLRPVSFAKYDAIKSGMTYEEAISVLGASGEELSRSEIAGNVSVMYAWKNSDGSNMNALFQNGKLISKAQFGLK